MAVVWMVEKRRVTPVSMFYPNPDEGATGSSQLGTGDSGTMQAGVSIRVPDTSMTPPLVCLFCTASGHRFVSTGKERDTESGNDYFGARYYASTMGRFLSPDPMNAGADESDPQSWNAYAYGGNNPLGAIDPTGEDYYLLGGSQCGQNGIECDKQGYLLGADGNRQVITDQALANGTYGAKFDSNGNLTGITTGQGTFGAQFFDASPNAVSANVLSDEPIAPSVQAGIESANGIYQAAKPFLIAGSIEAAVEMAGPVLAETYEAADAAYTPKSSLHGYARMGDRGSLSRTGIRLTKMFKTETRTAANGAKVFIREVGGKYNVVVEGNQGYMTSYKTISASTLQKLATTFGWQ
jgi:RHS repeat-associated protein